MTPDIGWVVEQGDVEGIAEMVKNLAAKCKSESFAQRIACRERAEQVIDKEKYFEKYIDLYERLIQKENLK